MIRTAWIGGSYEAATRQTITDLPPTAISRRHAEPGMGADVPLLKLIQAMPGASTHALLERLPGVKKETASRALIKMRSKRLIPIHRAEPDFDMMKSAYRYADEMLKARES